MMDEVLVRDAQLRRQGLGVLGVSLSAFMITYSLGYASPAISSMSENSDLELTTEKISSIASAVPGAAILSSIIANPLLNKIGRRYSLILSSFLYFISWRGTALSEDVDSIIFYRAICGFAVGIQAVGAIVYMSEFLQVDLRPKLGVIPGGCLGLGFGAVIALGSILGWRDISSIGLWISLIMLCLYIYLPESPYYLLSNERYTKAYYSLEWFRGYFLLASDEINKHRDEKDQKVKTAGLMEAFAPPHRRGIITAILLQIGQQMVGLNAVMFYPYYVFNELGSTISPQKCLLIVQIVATASSIYGLLLSATTERKKLLAHSNKVVLISLAAMAVESFLAPIISNRGLNNDVPLIGFIRFVFGIIPLIIISFYIYGFSMGWGMIPFLFLAEGLHSESRSIGNSLSISCNWIMIFIINKTFLGLAEMLGAYSLFTIYALATYVIYYLLKELLPETLNIDSDTINSMYVNEYSKKK